MLRVGLWRRDDFQRSDWLWGMTLFHPLKKVNPKCELTRSPVTQDGCKTTLQSIYKVITGENYDDWVKSFPENVKIDQHLGRLQHPNCFRWMSRWTLRLLRHYERNEMILGIMWFNILSTSVNITHTKLMQLLVSTRHWSVHSASN